MCKNNSIQPEYNSVNQGIKVDRKTVYEDIHALEEYGLEIDHPEYSNTYRLISRDFELAEIKLMIDSIQASKFLSEKTTRTLISKLEGLCSHYEAQTLQREVIVANRVKTMNHSIHYNVDGIHRAIAANKQVQFRYFDYDIRKSKRYFKKGAFYVVIPWRLIYADDNYYLLAYDEKAEKFKHFRVDKMDAVEETEAERIGKEAFPYLRGCIREKSRLRKKPPNISVFCFFFRSPLSQRYPSRRRRLPSLRARDSKERRYIRYISNSRFPIRRSRNRRGKREMRRREKAVFFSKRSSPHIFYAEMKYVIYPI